MPGPDTGDVGALSYRSPRPLLQGSVCLRCGDRKLPLPSGPAASVPWSPQIPGHRFAVNPCLPCVEDGLPHLSGLWCLHQGQTWWKGALDRAFGYVVAQAPRMDAYRGGPERVCTAKGADRTHLWHPKGPVGSSAVLAAGSDECPGGIRSPGHRFNLQALSRVWT